MKYTILSAESATELAQKVGEALEHGWQPQGGLCVYNQFSKDHLTVEYVSYSTTTAFAQAMVKGTCVDA
jgi:hypothetical protein